MTPGELNVVINTLMTNHAAKIPVTRAYPHTVSWWVAEVMKATLGRVDPEVACDALKLRLGLA